MVTFQDVEQIQGPNHQAVEGVSKFLIPLLFSILMVVLLAVWLTLDPRKLPPELINESLPAFELPLLRHESIFLSSSELEGQVTLLNAWAS